MLSSKQPITASQPGRTAMLSMIAMIALIAFSLPASAQNVNVAYLTSDITAVASYNDTNLVNPWGMSISPSGPWYVSDEGTGLSTVYVSSGQPQSIVITIPSASGSGQGTPTGTVYNGTNNFPIHGIPAEFLYCTLDGTVSGWNGGAQASIAVNNNNGAVYTGMALASAAGANYIYVANFNAATVEVYDGSFNPHSFGSNSFVDTSIPSGYAPFNIQLVGSSLVVTYGKQNSAKNFTVSGPGNGYVDVYDTEGNLQVRMAHVLFLNAPWGVVQAPASFSGFGNDLLVGNLGSGGITAYNISTGAWIGNMLAVSDLPLQIDGLWALAFGNGGSGGPTGTLYFTTGPYKGAHGIFGAITPHPGM
jgi:uncharacterized protein (TIGR03118 family)